MKTLRRLAIAIWALAAFGAEAQPAYPSRPITLLVGYTPGGSVDLSARTIAPELAKRLGQPVVVENVGGAGGQIAVQRAATALADGHTLLLGTSAEISVGRLINPAVKYDALKDLAVLGLIGTQPMVLVGAPTVNAKNTRELLGLLRAKPGKLSYGSAGQGSLPHLAGELFKQRSKTFAVHIPYRGAAPMITDLIGGQVDLGMLVLSSAMGQVRTGKLTAYGVTEPKRASQLPNVPALAETPGLEGFDISVFFGVFAPVKTPIEVQQKIATELLSTLKQPETIAKLNEAGFTLRALGQADAAAFIQQARAQYVQIVETSKIRE